MCSICSSQNHLSRPFVAFFHITYLFFNDWYIFGPQLTARTKKTEKIFPFPLIFPFQVHFFYPWGTKMWFSCNLSVWQLLTILILPLNLWPAALYPFLITFPSSRFRISHFSPLGSRWQVFREFKIRRLRTTIRLLLNMLLRIIKTTWLFIFPA